jgi:YggT family protein
MDPVALIGLVLYYLLLLYLVVMFVRLALDLARSFIRGWRPKGAALVLSEVTYALTDPPIRVARRVVKPIRTGGMAMDFGWSIVMLAVVVLIYVALVLRTV